MKVDRVEEYNLTLSSSEMQNMVYLLVRYVKLQFKEDGELDEYSFKFLRELSLKTNMRVNEVKDLEQEVTKWVKNIQLPE